MSRHYHSKVMAIPGDGYVVTITTNPHIVMFIPRTGLFEGNKARALTFAEAKTLAKWITKVFDVMLVDRPSNKIKGIQKAAKKELFKDTH